MITQTNPNSLEAFKKANLESQEKIILRILGEHPDGLTDNEVCAVLSGRFGAGPDKCVSARLIRLCADGKARKSGNRKSEESKRVGAVFVVVPNELRARLEAKLAHWTEALERHTLERACAGGRIAEDEAKINAIATQLSSL